MISDPIPANVKPHIGKPSSIQFRLLLFLKLFVNVLIQNHASQSHTPSSVQDTPLPPASGEMEIDQNRRFGIGSSSTGFSSSGSLKHLLPSSLLWLFLPPFSSSCLAQEASKITPKWQANASVKPVANTWRPITEITRTRHFVND